MLKFFRTIRKNMIDQQKTKRYFLYAIGEILLVVIGILVALQVNNWNEDRKTETYTFGSTSLHDQGPLIDSLVWKDIDPGHLAATFQGISNFKRLLFRTTKEKMEYSINHSRLLIQHIDSYLDNHE